MLFSAPAVAETRTATLSVTAIVQPSCTIAATPVDFGTMRGSEGGEAAGSVQIACTSGTLWSASANGPAATRKMSGSAGNLAYQLYSDSGRTRLWGDGSGGSSPLQGRGTGTPETRPIYGRIVPDGNGSPAGTYSDLITVTVTY